MASGRNVSNTKRGRPKKKAALIAGGEMEDVSSSNGVTVSGAVPAVFPVARQHCPLQETIVLRRPCPLQRGDRRYDRCKYLVRSKYLVRGKYLVRSKYLFRSQT
jgi:hypothetical protein